MSLDNSTQILSEITTYMKYAKYLPEKSRRETWAEIVDRNKKMHIEKFPDLKDEIELAYTMVYNKKVLPSMRSIQFAGKPIEVNPVRLYNCSYLPIDNTDAFAESMFLLLSGTGVGYSVQKHHVRKLPIIMGVQRPEGKQRKKRYLVGDSIEGWSDAIKMLVESYFYGKRELDFDFRDIRPKGAKLITSGGKAPGPEPLKESVVKITSVFERAIQERGSGTRLKPIEVHDIMCFIADAVLAGGIRRAAMSAIFSFDDYEMLECKFGDWWEINPQRGRANNSALVLRSQIKEEEFKEYWEKIKNSGSGEPGIFMSNSEEWGINPCQPSWAKLLTKKGITTIGEINVGDEIWSKEGWTKVLKKWSNGIKPIYKYKTNASVFYGTKNHKVVSGGIKVEAEDAETIDVITGPYDSSIVIDPKDVMDGLVLGDGTVHKASNNLVLLNIGKKDYDYFNSEVKSLIKKKRDGIGDYVYEINTSINYTELPKTYLRKIPKRFMSDANKMASFLRGLFSANGTVVGNRVVLTQASLDVIEGAQLMLSALGIMSYITTNKASSIKFSNGWYDCKQSYDLNISMDRGKFLSIIGFIQEYKNEKIQIKVGGRRKTEYDIVSVDLVSEEEVFDITVDNDSHTYWTQGCDVSNCFEVSLRANQFCNLTEINVSDIESQEDLEMRAKAAAFIGTIQASYTDFHYLRDVWKDTTEKEALVGVSMTGIGSGTIFGYDVKKAAKIAVKENKRVAKSIGINSAARVTTIKPSGTSSIVLGTSSGVHAWFDKYYWRRVRVGKNESIYMYLSIFHPEILEDEYFRPESMAVISVPQKAPENAIYRTESAIDTLNRVKFFQTNWVAEGHIKGLNNNNVSCTINIKDDEWDIVGKWMWENKDSFTGISVLPYDGGSYKQAPFESITENEFMKAYKNIHSIDLSKIIETDDNTNLQGELACAGGACEINTV